uniref:MAGUK p55 subfamily member 7 n=1 Tax=Plectus sambesii TaxID=2011161 RepID=A0A914UY16_9BILA
MPTVSKIPRRSSGEAKTNWTSEPLDTEPSTSGDFFKIFRTVLEGIVEAGGDLTSKETSESMHQLFERQDLKALIALHQFVSKHRFQSASPANGRLVQSSREVINIVQELTSSSEGQELAHLLNRVHIQALFSAHDDVANRCYEPMLPEIPHEVDEDEGLAVKVVRLVKQNEPLGATIKCDPDGSVVIARVIRGGVADRTGCIQVRDRVIEVNGVAVAGRDPTEIVKLLAGTNGTVTFKLIPADDEFLDCGRSTGVVDGSRPRVRSQFDYDPTTDPLHPCPEAGLTFRTGDVLELVECDDEHWWQARNEGHVGVADPSAGASTDCRVGLVPSRLLQEKRAAVARKTHESTTAPSVRGDTLDSRKNAKSASPRVRKIVYESHQAEELDGEQPRSYEDVSLLYPRAHFVRPIVLAGPPGVGRNELKRRLLMLNPDRFGTTIPHTSRPPRPHETDGVDYHFASRNDMEHWVRQGLFLEYGEYRGNLYGTLADSVRALISQGRIPVLNPHPQALRLLRTAEFKPFIVYIKPPPFPALKETRSTARARSTQDGGYQRGFSDDELEQMLASATNLERQYGQWFDYELVNGNLEFAFRELCELLQRVDAEPSWVPTCWVR